MKSLRNSFRRFLPGTNKQRRRRRAKNRVGRVETLERRSLLAAVVESGIDDQQLSFIGDNSGAASSEASLVASVYNATEDSYLVVWAAEDVDFSPLQPGESEVFGRFVNSNGSLRRRS